MEPDTNKKTILFIGDKHCTSVDQLKGYFSEDLTPESDIYAALLDYGRHGDIAKWLREMGEPELASKVESIAPDLSDHALYAQLKAAITGSTVKPDPELKPPFDKCFSFEGVKCDVQNNEAKVTVRLKVLMCANEKYELSVSCNWGTRGMIINPHGHPEGKTACFAFSLRKCPGKNIGGITVKADRKILATSDGNSIEFLVGDVKFKMIHVDGGLFSMGTDGERHQVTLSSYSIGETPVTQELWQAVMFRNPSYFSDTAQRPVECVSWNDCQEFIGRLNERTGKHFRLPTEAEWEFAARGGMKSKGYKYSGSNDVNGVAWYANIVERNIPHHVTHVVKTKKPNELGIYDMSGNVWEWCQDWWSHCDKGSQTNPTGPANGSYRVIRGGCFDSEADHCSLSYRKKRIQPDKKFKFLGFRLALSE